MKPWNKGLTKFNHPSLRKTSETLANKSRSNFWKWQKNHKPQYRTLRHSKDLAEFYGTMLGDGCVEKFERTDKFTISFNIKETEHIIHIRALIIRLFGKKPKTRKRKKENCTDLYLYEKYISERLKFPYGKKLNSKLSIPSWICKNNNYLRHCLKGLFETDGDWNVDNTYKTNVIKFNNHSANLLNDTYRILKTQGYNPQKRKFDVRLARKKEVYKFVNWIKFRQY